MNRAALGLQLSATGSLRDTIGVFVARVTPKGPAENAGIVEGDRIVSINGIDLRVNSADAGDAYASELPTRRLTREVGKLTPGKVAILRVSSGGRVRDFQVTAGRASDLREGTSFGMLMNAGPEGFMRRSMPRMNFEGMPGMRMEEMQKTRFEDIPRLREQMRVRVIGPEGSRFFYHDSAGTWTSSKSPAARTKAEKAAEEKAEKQRKDKR